MSGIVAFSRALALHHRFKFGTRYFTAQAASSLKPICDPSTYSDSAEEYANIDWNNLGFGLTPTDYMYVMKTTGDGSFEQGKLDRFGNLELSPASGVLNYGQGLYEGMKAFRRENGGIFLFRPDQNAARMQIGAERLCMPSLTTEQFLDALRQTVLANKRWIPPPGKGSLYIRPMLLGSGPILGLAPAPHYTFLVYVSPVGNYFKEGTAPLNIYIEEEYHRAVHGGAGGVKSITNYAPVMKPITMAKGRGFSDVLYLDSVHKRYVEEVSSCNIFIVKGNIISTPTVGATILPGITRKSIIDIARDSGYKVEERLVEVEELCEADEVFCTGTAVGVATVGSITYKGKRIEYKLGEEHVSKKLGSTLVGIQKGVIEDKRGWVMEIGEKTSWSNSI
ncbi:branched-chain-amino-acid aminotransferase 2, chloroplastic-like isoform X1 [Ipomoea triloba]|uniref:branched-chain-amino-acid aminotransferase 2, chloroplastic-like isoform X1 n=1 Tax=Ipomoea triloba TaxID=35885 RepID=UPI00125DD191|nr:branched-chain-amino-acid aminotransferase 2, chloroplastic-like isoform X1 [Ipomoea triloba]